MKAPTGTPKKIDIITGADSAMSRLRRNIMP